MVYLNMTAVKAQEVVATSFVKEDINQDGVVNTADVVAIYNYIASGELSGIGGDVADVNQDGTVNAADIAALYNKIASPTLAYENLIVCNEGNWQSDNGQLSFYNGATGEVTNVPSTA